MKKLIAVLASILVATAMQAATITFTGVVDASPIYPVGSTFVATFHYNPKKGGAIQNYTITIADVTTHGSKNAGNVAIGSDPSVGSVYFQVFNGSVIEITLQAATPDGVIPPIEQFNLNDWFQNSPRASGHMTSLPLITP
jgi:hypothetical protein